MGYNISTMYIWRNFNGECSCPTCKIRQKTESDFIDLYLSEAVMEDAEREKVNKYGFCEKHFDVLYAGNNKLGLTLQTETRIARLKKLIKPVKDGKSAKKHAENLKNEICDCIICRRLEDNMKRYYETTARLYSDDEKFRNVNFKEVNGFCYPCYVRLLENSSKAGKYAKQFSDEISQITLNSLDKLSENLKDFKMAFDYRSKKTPSKEASFSLKEASLKLYGEKPLSPEKKR